MFNSTIMYLLIIFIPLFSTAVAGLFGRFLGQKGAAFLTSACILLTSCVSWIAFFDIGYNKDIVNIKLFDWITSGNLEVGLGFYFDSVTVSMLILVTTVSGLVHMYSSSYMEHDPHLPRFMSYLSLFTFFMIILVTSDNLLQLFLGWEGIGVASYLLINFWYTRIQANKSAIKAMVVNRTGDVALALGIFAIYQTFQSIDFATIFAMADILQNESIILLNMEFHAYTFIGLLLFFGAVGKSAQLGLHTWLPDAMEGPTPVSALIHAATLVTAGVFLIIRCSPLLEFAPLALTVIVVMGSLTAFFAATVGLVQSDLKRVIAFSTCSQLGYMVFACGLSNYNVGLFHLVNHGFFKALLFLSAGAVIHAMADEQDLRKLGALIQAIPYSYTMILIGSLSLMGAPFLTGFYSKDAILEVAYSSYTIDSTFAFWLGTISAFCTAFYSLRLIYLTFLSSPNSSQTSFLGAHEAPWPMSLPLLILAFGSIFIGYLFRDLFIGLGTDFFAHSIFILPKNYNVIEGEFMNTTVKWLPVILSLFGAGIAIFLYGTAFQTLYMFKTSKIGRKLFIFFNNKWHFDMLQNTYIVMPLFKAGHDVIYKIIDRGLIEKIGPYGLSKTIVKLSERSSLLHNGLIYNYALNLFLFATIFLTLVGFWDFIINNSEIIAIITIAWIIITGKNKEQTT